jgi:AraC family transcriptional regulator
LILNRTHDALTYSERLDRVAAYIEAHLDEAIDLLTLADVAHLSSYHFHRTYHAISGETVAATVKRLRLHRSAGYLVQTSMSIAEIAKRTGHHSVQAFTRVFKTEYGLPPAHYREVGSHTRFTNSQENENLHHEVKLLEVKPMLGVSVEHRGSYLMIGRAFNKLYRWAQARNTTSDISQVIGIYDDDPFAIPEKQLHSRACLMFEQPVKLEPPLSRVEIAGGLCAVLRHQGPYADMRLTYQWLYGQWLPQSGYLVADAPVFEVYLNHPRDTMPADLLVDIYLPLQNSVF